MPNRAEAQLEMYKRFQDDPVNPVLNEWWNDLDYMTQQAITELSWRDKKLQQSLEIPTQEEERKSGLVEEVLSQNVINPGLFKIKIPKQTGTEEPKEFGVIKYNIDGSRDVVNDTKKLNLLLMDDKMPMDMTMEEMGQWSQDIRKKGELEKQGFRLYDVTSNYPVEPPRKETTILDVVRDPHVGQWRAWVNTFSRANKMRDRSSEMKELFENIGHNPDESIKKIAQLNAEIKGIPTSEAYAAFNDPTVSFGETMKRLGSDPIEILALGITESLVQFLPPLAYNSFWQGLTMGGAGATYGGLTTGGLGAVAGGLTGLGRGAITAAGMTSYNMEFTGKILESLEERGVDITNPQHLADAFQDEDLMLEVKALANKRAVPVAIMDMVSGGVAGTLTKKWKEIPVQMVFGGTGEAMGQKFAGEELNIPAIVMEMAAEPGQMAPVGMFKMGVKANQNVQQHKFNKTNVGKEILRAREEGVHDKQTLDMAEKLAKQNPEIFEEKSILQFSEEVKTITDQELIERGIDPVEFKQGEGVDPSTGKLRVLGSTEVENGQVIIKMYQGARPQDIVEEFYGNHYRRLDEESQKTLDTYYQKYKEKGGLLTKQELFEKEGTSYYFGYMETDSTMGKLYRKIKLMLDNMFNKSNIDPTVRKMYEDAGFGRIVDVDAKTGDVSYSVEPVFYNKSTEAVGKINSASLKRRNVKNFFMRQGVSKEELDAIKMDELLSQYKPVDSIPVTEIKKHIEKNEIQLEDYGTLRGLQEQPVTDEQMDDWYENEAEYEYYETRWDVVFFGESHRDMMGDEYEGFESELEAEEAVREEIYYAMDRDWEDIESGYGNYTIVEEETDDLENFPEGKKYHLYDGEYDPTPVETDQPFGFSTPEVPPIDPDKIIYTADTEQNLKEQWEESELPYYQHEIGIEEYQHELEEPRLLNEEDMPETKRVEPRHQHYTQPGGKDYEELVITLPGDKRKFRSEGHFPVDNPVVHTRFNTRYDKDGNKVLFIEEIQSDWHQEGAKGGYKKTLTLDEKDRIRQIESEIAELKKERKKYQVDEPSVPASDNIELNKKWNEISELIDEKYTEAREIQAPSQVGVADAPYKDFGWVTLAGKRLLRHAVDNDFDKIAWTTGKQQADRSNLRKHIDYISYKKVDVLNTKMKNPSYDVRAKGKKGNVFDRKIRENELEQYVGKGVASKIVAGEGERGALDPLLERWYDLQSSYSTKTIPDIQAVENEIMEKYNIESSQIQDKYLTQKSQSGRNVLSDMDLEIGGEARIRLYDTEISNRMKKLAGNLGTVELQTEKLETGRTTQWQENDPDIINALEVYEQGDDEPIVQIENEDQQIAYDHIDSMLEWRNIEYDVFNNMSIDQRVEHLYNWLQTRDKKLSTKESNLTDHQSIDITPKVKDKYSKPMPSFSVVPEEDFQSFNQGWYKNLQSPKYPYFNFFDGDVMVPISTRLKRINPVLKKILRDFEFKSMKAIREDRKRVKPFLDKIVNLAKTNRQAYSKLDHALKNSIPENALEVAREHGFENEYLDVREYLDEMFKRAEDAGVDMGYLDKYFPRKVDKYEKLLAELGREDQGVVVKAINKKKAELGRDLRLDEKAHIINGLLSNSRTLGKKSPHTKRRDGRIEIDANLNRFYQDSPTTLLQYIDSMNEMISIREFFGRGKNKDESVGMYVAKLVDDGVINPSQQEEVKKLFNARFGYQFMGKKMAGIKNYTYIGLMGSPTSALTQIGDMAWAFYKGGFYNTINEARKAVQAEFGKDMDQITPQDLGTDKVAQEFETSGGAASFLNLVFKSIGLTSMDRIGKTTLANAAIKKYQQRAKKGDPKLKSELEAIYGEETTQLIKDLKSGKTTDNVEMLAFNTLLDFQPAALSEMPVKYLDSPNGRIFYQLKTFTIKQFDVYRNEGFDKIAAGQVKEGLKNLRNLTIAFAASNATADVLKDLLLGRPIHGDDLFWDNMLRLIGVSRFHAWQARDRGVGTAALKLVVPPQLSIADQLTQDYLKIYRAMTNDKKNDLAKAFKNLWIWNYLPIVGKTGYWRLGGGPKKINNQERKRFRKLQNERRLNKQERNEYRKLIDEAVELGELTRSGAEKLKRGML